MGLFFNQQFFKLLVISALDESTVKAMLGREKDLHRCSGTQRAYSLRCIDSIAVARQIQTRIVREYGLPDEAIEIFATIPQEYGERSETDKDTEVFGRMWNEPPDLQLQSEPSESPQVGRQFIVFGTGPNFIKRVSTKTC